MLKKIKITICTDQSNGYKPITCSQKKKKKPITCGSSWFTYHSGPCFDLPFFNSKMSVHTKLLVLLTVIGSRGTQRFYK